MLYNFNFSLQEKGDTNNQILYGLYAVMVHHGSSLYSSRYVSYVKIRPRKEEDNVDGERFRTKYHKITVKIKDSGIRPMIYYSIMQIIGGGKLSRFLQISLQSQRFSSEFFSFLL